MCAYLFEYHSVFGPWRGTVALDGDALVVDGRAIPLTRVADLSVLELAGVDLVMECTGRADAPEVAGRGLRAGAGRVLVSGPSIAAEFTLVLGANEAGLAAQRIVSNASCTTNALLVRSPCTSMRRTPSPLWLEADRISSDRFADFQGVAFAFRACCAQSVSYPAALKKL